MNYYKITTKAHYDTNIITECLYRTEKNLTYLTDLYGKVSFLKPQQLETLVNSGYLNEGEFIDKWGQINRRIEWFCESITAVEYTNAPDINGWCGYNITAKSVKDDGMYVEIENANDMKREDKVKERACNSEIDSDKFMKDHFVFTTVKM